MFYQVLSAAEAVLLLLTDFPLERAGHAAGENLSHLVVWMALSPHQPVLLVEYNQLSR